MADDRDDEPPEGSQDASAGQGSGDGPTRPESRDSERSGVHIRAVPSVPSVPSADESCEEPVLDTAEGSVLLEKRSSGAVMNV